MADLRQDIEGLNFEGKLHVLHELLSSLGGDSMPYASADIKALGSGAKQGPLRFINDICGQMPHINETSRGGYDEKKVEKREDGLAPNALVPSHSFRSEDQQEPDWNQPYLYTTGAMLDVIASATPKLTRVVSGDHDMGVGYVVPDLKLVKQHIAALADLSSYSKKLDDIVEEKTKAASYWREKPEHDQITNYKHTLSVIEEVANSLVTDLDGQMGTLYQAKVDELRQAEKDASKKAGEFSEVADKGSDALARRTLLQQAIDRAAKRGNRGWGLGS